MEAFDLALLGNAIVLALLLLSCRRTRALYLEARTDELTGIGNKRSWRETVAELESSGQPFSFVLFDVANLKAMNEALGHERADAVLRKVAQHVREGDTVGHRIGGDEFVVALPGVSSSEAEKVRSRIEDLAGLTPIAAGVLSFIVGAAGEWRTGDNLTEQLTAVDFALERRKVERKTALGLPLSRTETLAAIAA